MNILSKIVRVGGQISQSGIN